MLSIELVCRLTKKDLESLPKDGISFLYPKDVRAAAIAKWTDMDGLNGAVFCRTLNRHAITLEQLAMGSVDPSPDHLCGTEMQLLASESHRMFRHACHNPCCTLTAARNEKVKASAAKAKNTWRTRRDKENAERRDALVAELRKLGVGEAEIEPVLETGPAKKFLREVPMLHDFVA